jgi:hypothetical protein
LTLIKLFVEKRKKIVKENKESIEIFRNIWIFNMESPYLINYLTNMCWSCPSQKWWDPMNKTDKSGPKLMWENITQHILIWASRKLWKAISCHMGLEYVRPFRKIECLPTKVIRAVLKKNPYGMVNPKKLGYG